MKNTKDFGYGFYCTIIREQAERWAKRYDRPVVSVYTVRMNTGLNILEFREMTDAWLDFIIDCRNGAAHNNDIVIGAMANDQIYNYIADYVDGIITRDQFWSLARFIALWCLSLSLFELNYLKSGTLCFADYGKSSSRRKKTCWQQFKVWLNTKINLERGLSFMTILVTGAAGFIGCCVV